jgi:hypothetical protein
MDLEQKQILGLIDSERYEDALTLINNLPPDLQKSGRMIMAKGDAFYELGNDLDALLSYSDYINLYPDEHGIGFALFGAAMCMKNMDLQAEAQMILLRIDPAHEGVENELAHSAEIIEKQRNAKSIFLELKLPEGKRG